MEWKDTDWNMIYTVMRAEIHTNIKVITEYQDIFNEWIRD